MTRGTSEPPRLARRLLAWATADRYRESVLGVLALASGRLLDSLLFEVSAVDPFTYVAVAVLLSMVALAATCIPALRATRVDPLTSMRAE